MPVVRNGDYWVYEWTIQGTRIRRSAGLKVSEATREQVRAKEAVVKRKVLKELGLTDNRPSVRKTRKTSLLLSEAIERCYEERWSKSDYGIDYRNLAINAMNRIGDKPIHEITSSDFEKLKKSLYKDRLTPATVNRYLSSITAVLNQAHLYWNEPGFTVINTVPAVKREDESGNMRLRIVEPWEEEQILAACDVLSAPDNDFADFKDLFVVLIDTGMRKSEALNLSYAQNIDFQTRAIYLTARQRKNKIPVGIPMTSRVHEVLLRRGDRGDQPFNCFKQHQTTNRLTRVLEKAGLPTTGERRIVLHSLRHTFATRLVRKGVSIFDVSKLLGHTTVTTTERFYAHLDTSTLRPAIEMLETD